MCVCMYWVTISVYLEKQRYILRNSYFIWQDLLRFCLLILMTVFSTLFVKPCDCLTWQQEPGWWRLNTWGEHRKAISYVPVTLSKYKADSGRWLWESGTFIFLTKMLSSNYLVELKVESKFLIIIIFLYWWNSCGFYKWVTTCKGCDKKTEHFSCSLRGEILLLVSIKVNWLIQSDWRKMQKIMGARQAKLELPRLCSFKISLKPA